MGDAFCWCWLDVLRVLRFGAAVLCVEVKAMATFEAEVRLPQEEVERINRLLSVDCFEEMTEDERWLSGIAKDACEGIFCVTFPDGSFLNFDLCSGSSNYFDDVVWTSADFCVDVVLECTFSLEDIEFDVGDTHYIVRIIEE